MLISCYLSVEVVVQVPLLVLRAQHVHDFAVLRSAGRALGLALSVAFKAVLVERMATEEMNGRQLQGAVAHVALCLLKYLGTVWTKNQNNIHTVQGGKKSCEKVVEHPCHQVTHLVLRSWISERR